MSYKTLFIFSLVFACMISLVPHKTKATETDYQKELLEEIVKIKDGKMVITEFGLLSVLSLPDEKIQLKLYSEAPSDSVISQDNFVAATTMLQTIFFWQIATEITQEYGSKSRMDDSELPFDFKELDEPIGKVDLEINIYMSDIPRAEAAGLLAPPFIAGCPVNRESRLYKPCLTSPLEKVDTPTLRKRAS